MTGSPRTHYEVLGVDRDASPEQIKAAYRKLARTMHPDVATGSATLFGMVNEAHDVLRDPVRRRRYDRDLAGPAPAPAPTPAPPTAPASAPRASAGTSAPGAASPQPGFAPPRPATTGPAPSWQAPYAARSSAGYPLDKGRGARLAWWTFPLVYALSVALGLVRFTGVTAPWFGAHRHMPIFGGSWDGVPTLPVNDTTGIVSVLIEVAVLCALACAAYLVRKQFAPVPKTEKVGLLAAVAAQALAGEFIMASGRAWAALAFLALAYACWVFLLAQLPAPASTMEWQSFRAWRAGARGRRRRAREQRPPTRTERAAAGGWRALCWLARPATKPARAGWDWARAKAAGPAEAARRAAAPARERLERARQAWRAPVRAAMRPLARVLAGRVLDPFRR